MPTTGHPTSPAEVTEEHKLHSCSHLHSHSLIPQTCWFPAAYTNPGRDRLRGVPMQSPAFTPACLSIATIVGSEQADLDSVGNVKVAHPSFILLPVDGMDIPCYLNQLSTSALLVSSILEISTFKYGILSSG